MTLTTQCPCCSGKPFAECCEPVLLMQQKPKTAKALMRARYCAFALGAGTHREFLIRSWHPATPQQVHYVDLTNDSTQWNGLEVLNSAQDGDSAQVEFIARFNDSKGQPHQHHETSQFYRVQGQWLYFDGKVIES